MKIKAADIARNLNLSKATVSLVLNDKPGVSEKTRKKIFDYIDEVEGIETENQQKPGIQKIIKVIFIDNKLRVVRDPELDVCPDSLAVFERESRNMGYIMGLTYVTPSNTEDVHRAIKEANADNVAGVILYATEMFPDQYEPFKMIKKPMVVYDNDMGNEYHSVTFGGMEGTRDCVDYLVERGCRNIKYMANTMEIFNFLQRRAGFRAGLRKNNLELQTDSMITMGKNINEVCENMLKYLDTHELPDAFIMENYQVSVGIMRALRRRHISIPERISLIGIDELPDYLTGDVRMTSLRMEHMERSYVTMLFLQQEIKGAISCKFKSYSNCSIIPGYTVRSKPQD